MKRFRCVGVVVFLGLVLVVSSAAAGDRATKPRPFWGSFAGEATFPESDVCLDVTGAPWQTLSESEGKMTHLGRTVFTTAHCSTVDGSAAVGGEATFTAANGDEVWATYTALTVVWPPPLIVQEIDLTIVGGTGRFENASGHLVGMVYVTFEGFSDPSWPLRFVLSGTITF